MKTIVKIGLLLFGLVSYGSLFGQEPQMKPVAKPALAQQKQFEKLGQQPVKKGAPVKKKAAPQKLQPVTDRKTY